MKTILYVCTGNTCRSPIAEYLTNEFAKELGKELNVSSAGLKADGSPISNNSLKVLEDQGIDASKHVSKHLTQELISTFDTVITMTQKHKDTILGNFDIGTTKIATLAEVGGGSGDVEDPYEQDLPIYQKTKTQINQYVSKFLSTI